MRSFWAERVAPLVAPLHETYIVDFAVLKGGDVAVIELNPFNEQTAAGARAWSPSLRPPPAPP